MASITLILLYSLVAYLLYGDLGNKNKPLNLITNPVQMIFGQSSIVDNNIKVQLDEIGVALALFSIADFDTSDYSQLELTVNNLPKNYQVKLVLVSKENPAPIELPLLQPDGAMQSNLLIFDNNWSGEIKQLGLRIMPQDELGLSIPLQHSIIVSSAVLNNNGYFQNYFTLLDYWLEYEPWTYLSISHLKTNNILTIYAQPVVFVMLWIFVCLMLHVIFFKKRINFVSLLLSWFLLDILFIHNLNGNHNWVQDVYSSETKIVPDDNLYNLSQSIQKSFGIREDLLKMKNQKIFVLTTDKYRGLRLVYHLLPLNVGFLGAQLPDEEFKVDDYILSYDFPENRITPSFGVLQHNGISVKVKQISSGDNFIFMKVVN